MHAQDHLAAAAQQDNLQRTVTLVNVFLLIAAGTTTSLYDIVPMCNEITLVSLQYGD